MTTLTQTTPSPTAPAAASATATTTTRAEPPLLPPVDVVEDSKGITLYADLPGVSREHLQVRVDGDQLVIEGEAVLPAPPGLVPSHAEVTSNRYQRTFTLSKELDTEQVSAELAHGVLRLRIPKAAHLQPRRIQVQVA